MKTYFRKGKNSIEAVQYTKENAEEVHSRLGLDADAPMFSTTVDEGRGGILMPGDWLARGVGGYYAIPAAEFDQLYEAGPTELRRVSFLASVDHRTYAADAPEYGASHLYHMVVGQAGHVQTVKFQKGPIKEVGLNGVQDAQLLSILIDRLRGFNAAFPSRENAIALTHLQEAENWMIRRTLEREQRGVEGTSNA